MYKLKNKNEINNIDFSKHFNADETAQKFIKVKTCPYIPNSLLIFPRTPFTFHGVEKINIEEKERNLLLLNYYLIKKTH